MEMMNRIGRILTILTACSLFMGCASFTRNNLPNVGVLLPPAPDAEKPAATFEFSSEVDMMGKRSHPENARSMLEAELVEVLHESGYFATLDKGSDGKDLSVNVHLVNSGNPAALVPAMITGFSLYTIPSWVTDTFNIVCTIKAADGKEYEYTLEDSITSAQWLPMIFAFPFNMPNKVGVEVRKNIYRNLIMRMQEDGLLPKSGNLTKTSNLMISFEIAPA